MRPMTTGSRLRTTTSALGSTALGVLLTYVGYLIAVDPGIALTLRALVASALMLAAAVLVVKVMRASSRV